jgi:phosphatidylglycerophosphatase C
MKKSIALFDFDGTITTIDSSQYFYKSLYSSKAYYFFKNYFLCICYIFLYKIQIISYLSLKKYRLHIHTSKFHDKVFNKITSEFYTKYFSDLLNPKAMERIFWHKNQGHDVWVISASFDFLLHEWSVKNDINLITNKTVFKNFKRRIVGKDVNYDAKIEYLQLYVNLDEFSDIYAYGDSDGDKSMLRVANYKFYKPFRN